MDESPPYGASSYCISLLKNTEKMIKTIHSWGTLFDYDRHR